MSKHTAFSFLLIASIFLIFSFAFPAQSFAVISNKLYDCINDSQYRNWADGSCDSSSGLPANQLNPNDPTKFGVQCIDMDKNKTVYLKWGQTCAELAATYYSGLKQENKTIIGQCQDKCTFTGSKPTCDRNQNNHCEKPPSSCNALTEQFCINYIYPTPTLAPTTAPTPTPTP